ncbi:MAG: UDP-N-acetylmuramate dehydrogenase [Candidatus Azobacteroides sp.]|nr:UDP-N-acetylmuramate dehydrogenase [Candidatus Azobacteroides sp.]
MKIFENHSLFRYNTFGIDVKTKLLIEYSDLNELSRILSSGNLIKNPLFHIGGGSNLLFTKDFDGTILHSAVKYIVIENETDEYVDLKVGSGVVWDDLVLFCVENDFRGIENLSLIPGEVGASAVQNIGAYGVEVKDFIRMVDVVEIASGQEKTVENKTCRYAYRSSVFKRELKNRVIITNVYFRLYKQIPFNISYGTIEAETLKFGEINIANVRKAVVAVRESKLPDPDVAGNAGSFFMNPIISGELCRDLLKVYPSMPFYAQPSGRVKVPAGWLIEQCGWKGKQVGNVMVHHKQALVIVNKGGATGLEVLHLSRMIQRSVKERFGIDLDPEVNVM